MNLFLVVKGMDSGLWRWRSWVATIVVSVRGWSFWRKLLGSLRIKLIYWTLPSFNISMTAHSRPHLLHHVRTAPLETVKVANVSREECDGYKVCCGYLLVGFRSVRELRCRGWTTREKNECTCCHVLLGCWGKCLGNDNTDPSRSSRFPNPSYYLLSLLKWYIFIYPSICLRGL